MGPLADLLVADPAQADPRLDVTHIPHRDARDALLLTEIHHFARRLVEEVTLLAGEVGAELGFALEQALRSP